MIETFLYILGVLLGTALGYAIKAARDQHTQMKRGERLPFQSQAAGNIQYCSSCGIGCPKKTYFCPHCGADMTGGADG